MAARLALICLIVLASSCVSRANAREYDKTYSIAGRANVTVRTNDGRVRVTTSDTKQVEFHVRYHEGVGVGIGGGPHIDSQQNGDSVALDAEIGSSFSLVFGGTRGMEIEVRMPRDADLRLDSKDGGVEVTAVNGHIVIHTDDGSIKASQLNGTVELGSSDGSIRVDTVKGDLKLRSDDGSIGAEHVDGKCDVASNDGSIRVDGRFDSLNIRSDDGSVVARVESGSLPSSTWQVRTSDGSVRLALPPDLKANLDASSNSGSIRLEPPVKVDGNVTEARIQGTMNGGGPALLIHTSSGSIRVSAI
jgi:DUF4097 and DUF4098 domain-containing protein YvlB